MPVIQCFANIYSSPLIRFNLLSFVYTVSVLGNHFLCRTREKHYVVLCFDVKLTWFLVECC